MTIGEKAITASDIVNEINNREAVILDDYAHSIEKDHQRVVNPLLPPERSYPYRTNPIGVPINIPTRGYIPQFQQIGIITKKTEGEPVILPLYGKPVYPGSSKWMYYTSTDKFPSIKLPVLNNNKDCQNEYGCNELYDSETINVPSYNKDFSLSIYQYDKPRYIPVI